MDDEIELVVREIRYSSTAQIARNVLRVLVDSDFTYSYCIDEDLLVAMLAPEQKEQYFSDQSYTGGKFHVSFEVAKKIIKEGQTPYNKQEL